MASPAEGHSIRHREVFPKLDLVAAKSALDNLTTPICVFHLGRRMVGQLIVPDFDEDSIVVNYLFAMSHVNKCESEERLPTSPSPTSLDCYRRVFLCRGCGQRRWSLYFKSSWACASCLKLLYRSQLLDKEVKLWAARDALED